MELLSFIFKEDVDAVGLSKYKDKYVVYLTNPQTPCITAFADFKSESHLDIKLYIPDALSRDRIRRRGNISASGTCRSLDSLAFHTR